MRTWVWTLVLLVIAVALAVAARDHAGNVIVLVPPYRLEASLAFAVSALILLFILAHLLLRLAGWTLGVGQRVKIWRQQRQLVREHERLEQGWVNLLQGHYAKAEQDFDEVSARTGSPSRRVLSRLSAARAAQAMQQFDRADAALKAARDSAARHPALAVGAACTAADILLLQGRAAEALALLEPLQNGGSRHVHVQRLLLRAYLALPSWNDALKLARSLARHNAGDVDLAATLETAAANCLRAAPDDAARRSVWKSLKANEKVMPGVALAAADVFSGDPLFVRRILQEALDERLDPSLLTAYAQCDMDEVRPRLQRAEGWLRSNPHHPELLRVLGSLCLRGQLWGSATTYLQRSLEQKDDPRTHALLGSLYDLLEQPQQASRHWRQATAAVVGLTVLDRSGALPAADTGADPQRLAMESSDFVGDTDLPALADRPLDTMPVDAVADEHELGLADPPPAPLPDPKALGPNSSTQ